MSCIFFTIPYKVFYYRYRTFIIKKKNGKIWEFVDFVCNFIVIFELFFTGKLSKLKH